MIGALASRKRDGSGHRSSQWSTFSLTLEHLKPWMLWATAEDTPEAAETRCRRFAGNYLLNEDFVLGVWAGGVLAGGTGFHLR